MSTADNKRLVRRYVEQVVNTGNVERLAEFISPDYRETNALAVPKLVARRSDLRRLRRNGNLIRERRRTSSSRSQTDHNRGLPCAVGDRDRCR